MARKHYDRAARQWHTWNRRAGILARRAARLARLALGGVPPVLHRSRRRNWSTR